MNIFLQFAICNRIVNDRMSESLKECGEKEFVKKRNCYYQTIFGICDHIYVADVVFLRDMAISLENQIMHDDLFTIQHKYLVKEIEELNEYFNKRTYLDKLIIKFVESIQEKELDKTVYITTNLAGDKTGNKLYKVLCHYFNHQIHHRGHISQILDEIGIENDFSNMNNI